MIQLLTSHRRGNGNLMFRPPQRWRFVKFFYWIRAVFWSAAGDDPQQLVCYDVLRVLWRDVVFEPQKMCFQVKFDRPNLRFVKATAEMHQMKLTAHPTLLNDLQPRLPTSKLPHNQRWSNNLAKDNGDFVCTVTAAHDWACGIRKCPRDRYPAGN